MAKTTLGDKKLNTIVRKKVIAILQEFLDDPDFGLELTEYAKKKLERSLASKRRVPLEQILKKYKI